MQVTNQDEYKKYQGINSQDGYSYDVVKFMGNWAELMEESFLPSPKLARLGLILDL